MERFAGIANIHFCATRNQIVFMLLFENPNKVQTSNAYMAIPTKVFKAVRRGEAMGHRSDA